MVGVKFLFSLVLVLYKEHLTLSLTYHTRQQHTNKKNKKGLARMFSKIFCGFSSFDKNWFEILLRHLVGFLLPFFSILIISV